MYSTIEIRKISITDLDTDVIVNAANEALAEGGGVCGAIFQAAGRKELQAACDIFAHCDTGDAVITPGFRLKAKYVIHAVGPQWTDGKHGEPERLRRAYKKALELAVVNHCHSIAFPLISAGIYHYPVSRAWCDALHVCKEFLDELKDYQIRIVFAVLNDDILAIGRKELINSAVSVYKIAEKEDWKTYEMPEQQETFLLDRTFSAQQMATLRHGNIPQEMEDKWFWYMEGDTLYAHRSWTGFCIFRIDFQNSGQHRVTVNRNPEQYTCTSLEEDKLMLNKLLDWWTQPVYDYYHEWLSETVDNINRAGVIKEKLQVGTQSFPAVFFHRPEEPDGYLSNWYTSPFNLDGIHFTSVEQYIMYQKCLMFGDTNSANQILSTDDTAKQQKIGRNAKGYVGSVWAGMRQMVAFRGLMEKFRQNEDLKQKLIETGDAWLVECAGSDKIWACGIRLDDDRRFDAANWDGQNILGFVLMEVRRKLRD